MPIRWSAVKVGEKVAEIEELMNSIKPTLWQIREKVGELKQVPHLPGYIDQPASMMTDRVERFKDSMNGYIQRIRKLIPEEALEEEQNRLKNGSTPLLI